jgi:hypothetical protein
MSEAHARRVRVELMDRRGGNLAALTQPSPRGRGINWFLASFTLLRVALFF